MVLWCWVNLQCRGVLNYGKARAYIFSLIYHFSPLFPSLWEEARYKLKYCLKRPLNPNQSTNQPSLSFSLSLGDGPIYTEILPKRAVKPKPTNQPTNQPHFITKRQGGGRVVQWSQGKLPVPGHPTIWMIVGQGPIALAVGAAWGCLDIFTLLCPFSSLSPSFWETARYRLKYCLKGPLNPKQPTNEQNVNVEQLFITKETLTCC